MNKYPIKNKSEEAAGFVNPNLLRFFSLSSVNACIYYHLPICDHDCLYFN